MWELSQDLVLLHAIQNATVDVNVNEGKIEFPGQNVMYYCSAFCSNVSNYIHEYILN